MMNTFIKNRKKDIKLSIFNPDFTCDEKVYFFLSAYMNTEWETILDYGAGNSPYRSFFKYKKYITADVCQNDLNNIDLIIKDNSNSLDIKNDSFDLILCMDVLEHVEDIKYVIAELYRVLKKEGVLIINMPFIYREHEMPYDYARYTSIAINHRLSESGFKKINVTKYGNLYFTLYSLWNEFTVKNNECKPTLIEKISRKLFNLFFLPLLNCTLFRINSKANDSIYHHLFIIASK